MKKSTSLFFALLLSTQLMANETKQSIIEINSNYNESQIFVGLTRSFTEEVPYTSTCQRTEVGPPVNQCNTVQREVCITVPTGPAHKAPAPVPQGPGHRAPSPVPQGPGHQPAPGPTHAKTCRMESARECRLVPSTRLVNYSCTKTRLVNRTVSDGTYHLRTIINVLNPEMIYNTNNCIYSSTITGTSVNRESVSCGNYALKVHSNNKHSITSRDEAREMSVTLVDKNEILQAVRNVYADRMELNDGILKIETGRINNLREINLSLSIKQSRFLIDKKLETSSVSSSNMQLRQLANGKSEIIVDLEGQFKGFKDGKKHQVIAELSVNLDGKYIGIQSHELKATYGKSFK